ncbi:MAG: cell division protein ZipA C-terminal FtsZ-binding domain-containing protein [Pseudomonadota bacterium]|nr:cell division protein ZipA C-terminal FtsZ-binding domain-containing protein [Pseudomonadota bacterium]
MNELQLGLAGVGIIVVVAVVVFNRMQERRFRRKTEASFGEQEDILLKTVSGRNEPVLVSLAEPLPEEIIVEAAVPVPEEGLPASVDPAIDYVSWVLADSPIIGSSIKEILRKQPVFTKSVLWLGLRKSDHHWQEVMRASDDTEFVKMVARVQLVDRSGPISARDLSTFCTMVQHVAQPFRAVCPEPDEARAQAVELDEVCAEVDVQVGINIFAHSESLAATQVRALAESIGMKLMKDGMFHKYDEAGNTVYTLSNYGDEPFDGTTIRQMTTHGITFLVDVPKVKNGLEVFDEVVSGATKMAQSLNAILADDNQKPLSPAGIAAIRRQLEQIYKRMQTFCIKPGSDGAMRLFS